MTKIAVIADIHGNLPALEAVLEDIEAEDADLIVANGDLADGPFPKETMDLLLRLGDKCRMLRGNSDRWLVEEYDGRFQPQGTDTDQLVQWAAKQMTRRQRDVLAGLPLLQVIDHAGLGRLGFCHATARSDNEMFLVDSSMEHAREAFAALDASTMFIGHSHMPFDRLFDRRRVVNTGSVGMPYGHVGASWALIEKHVVLRRTMYDLDAAAARMACTEMPDVDAFIQQYVRTSFSDREALEAFRSVMQRQQDQGSCD